MLFFNGLKPVYVRWKLFELCTLNNSYLSYRIIDSDPRKLNLKTAILKQVLLAQKNCLYYDATFGFLVWLRTGSNPADNNRF